ncbi:alkaline shock response membrane anchor protein AmaP [Streptomyces sp. JJ36]|uniref:alkaline shock response membrane anchor protein AmaP n=1 Tax=Streptomyces sp. JJ36 TaxID=2736645 RepID=UPI001F3400AD|nr:alkaline shock response membrane anchor protein AmaP [Streptomyces sp. JJ36]MCF6526300.1 alkaline shock response membrane anchor protein AmaP [Streptomyces sp. JJ36]
MLRTVNRVLLGLAGLLLLLLGLAVLAGGLDLQRRWDFSLGSGWPWAADQDVLLTEEDRTRRQDEGWWWPAVIGGLAVLLVLSLWWLLAQLRRARLGEVLVESGDGEGALLRGRALENVVAAEARALTGIERARVRLLGRRTTPRARVGLLLAPHADPGRTVERLRTEALENARQSAGLAEFPAEVRLRAARHRAERVS